MKKYEELELNVISFTNADVYAQQQQDQIQTSQEQCPPKCK